MKSKNEHLAARPVAAARRSAIEAVTGGRTLAPIARQPVPSPRVWRVAEPPAQPARAPERDLLTRLLRRLIGERTAA